MAGITRRTLTGGLTAATLVPGLRVAHAQPSYPPAGQTIKVVVPYVAGGSTDIVGRVVAERLSAMWNAQLVVENVPGAGANIGMDRVAKGPTDGTMLLVISPNLALNRFMYSRLSYDPDRDITPISQVVSVPNLLCVRKTLPVNSVAELIAYAKANPGKLNYASSGVGTTIHLSAELFKAMTGTDMVHVAYRGSTPAVTDLVGGSVDLMFDNIPTSINLARDGQIKPIAITTAKRSTIAPEFAPIADTLPGYDTTSWFGIGVRTGTPKAICDIIERDVRALCRETPVRDRFASLIADTVGTSSAEFTAYVASERDKWGKLINDLKIKAE